tara:strand:- start:434 stop:2380 length:1947 start_codon:yes stop_codon:yes gene_type:complete
MAIDMSKVKGASSTEYGESLLGQIQESNERINAQNNKRAEKDVWKNIGLNVGIGLVNNYQENEQAKFLALEGNASKILQTKNVYTGATLATEEEEAAQAHEEGYDSYFNSIAEKRVREKLTSQYAGQGVYSKVQLEGLVKSGAYNLGEQLRKAHQGRYKAAQDYLETTGEGGKTAYLDILKKQKPTDLKGMVNNFVGSFTGLTGGEALNSRAEEIFDSSEKFKNYQTIYQQTKNSDIAVLFAEGLPEKLNPARIVYGKTAIDLGEDELGNKRHGLTAYNPSSGQTWIAELGTGEVTTETSEKQRNNFSLITAGLEKTYPNFVVRGEGIAGALSPELKKELSDNIGAEATATGIGTYSGDKQRIAYHEAKNKLLQNQTGAMALQLHSQFPDMGTDQVDSIAGAMLSIHIKNPKSKIMSKGVGQGNPIVTFLAETAAVGSGNIKQNNSFRGKLLGADGINFFTAYKNASKNERVFLETALDTIHERTTDSQSGQSLGIDVLKAIVIEAENLQILSGNKDVEPLSDIDAFVTARNSFGTDLQAQVEGAKKAEAKLEMGNIFKSLSVVASINNNPSITRRKSSKLYKNNIAIIESMTTQQKNRFETEKNKRIKYLKDILPKLDYTQRPKYRKELTQLQENYDGLVNKYYKKD